MTDETKLAGGPLNRPVDFSSAYSFSSSESLAETHQLKYDRVRYGRDNGSGQIELEKALEEWHPGFRVLSFRSGMAALTTLFHWGWQISDKQLVQEEIYRKTESLVRDLHGVHKKPLARLPMLKQPHRRQEIEVLEKNTLMFFETPSNPHLRIPEWPDLLSIQDTNPLVFVDATLSGLGNLSHELVEKADAIVYSLTKYIGGHNDLIGGALFVRPDRYQELWEIRSRMGNIIGPMEAFLALRSLKTLSLRWHRQCDVAEEVFRELELLQGKGSIGTLNFPGGGSNSDQEYLANRTLTRMGAVLSFTVVTDQESLARKMKSLEAIKMAPSFGSTDSLIEICSLMSQPEATLEELAASGVEPTLVRLSVGVEPAQVILSDLRRLTASSGKTPH